MMQGQKSCKNNIRGEEEQTTVCCKDETRKRGKRYRHKAGGEGKIREQREKHGKKDKTSKTTSVIATAFAVPPLNSTNRNETYHSM